MEAIEEGVDVRRWESPKRVKSGLFSITF